MPLPAVSRRRHSVFRLSLCLCLWWCAKSLWTRYLNNCSWQFPKIYNLGAVGDRNELIRFWDQKVREKVNGHEIKWGQKSTFVILKVVCSNVKVTDDLSVSEEHSESADLCKGDSGSDRSPYPESGLRSLDSRWLPKFNGDLLVQSYICGKIFVKIRLVCPEIWAKWWKKCPVSQCWRILKKIPGSASGSGWRPKFNHFFLVHRYVDGKIFMKIWPVVFT